MGKKWVLEKAKKLKLFGNKAISVTEANGKIIKIRQILKYAIAYFSWQSKF